MDLSMRLENNSLVCGFPDHLDTNACAQWQDDLIHRVEQERLPVVFDMSGVVYVASAFLRVCLLTFKKAGADNFRMLHVAPEIKKVLKIAGMDTQLHVE